MLESLKWRGCLPWVKRLNPWLMLAPVYSSLFVIVAYWLGHERVIEKQGQEYLAIALIMVPTVILPYRYKVGHGPLYLILAFLAASLLYREIHLPGTGNGVYVCLFIVMVWTVVWWSRIAPQLEEGRTFALVAATLFTYFCSQVIARRVFRGIPGEQTLHVELKEVAENMGHLLFIVTSLYGLRSTYRK